MAYGSAIYKGISSTVAIGTTSLSVPYPVGITAGNLIVLCTTWKASVGTVGSQYMNTPSGFQQPDSGITQLASGQGTQGTIDQGPVFSSVYYRIATGTESGSVTLSWTAAITSCQSAMIFYSKPLDCEWGSTFGLAGFDSIGGSTSWVTVYSNQLNLKPNETIVSVVGVNTDNYTYSSKTFSQSGLSITTTPRYESGTTNGTHHEFILMDHKVTSGTSSSSAWGFTMTASGSSTYTPSGPIVALVIRVVPYKILKRWNGSIWRRSPARSWNGSAWQYSAANISRPIKRWDGSSWSQVSSLYLYPDPSIYNISSSAQSVSPIIYNGHETDIATYNGWITFNTPSDTKVHKNTFGMTLNIEANTGAARTGYVYFMVDGITYRTLTINQAAPVYSVSVSSPYVVFNADGLVVAGDNDITVTSSGTWSTVVNYATESGWISRSPTTGINGGTCTISVLGGYLGSGRQGAVTFNVGTASAVVNVSQLGVV